MKREAFALLITLAVGSCVVASAEAQEKASLASLTLKSGANILGEVRSENAATLVIFDLNTGDEKTVKLADIKNRVQVTETQAISRAGLPRFLAWRVKKELNGPASGKIAEVTPSAIYLTIGSKDGIEVGKTLAVFRDEGDLKDPDTGDVIGRKRSKLAQVEVTEVQESYCKAKRLDDSKVELKPKDAVEQEGVNLAVAIMPILDFEGDETTAGKTLAEQISTVFVSRGITVVERERINVVLSELDLQQNKAFAPEATQKIGKQLGAVAVVTGTIAPKGSRAEAHVRLIRVQTGEAVVAASQVVEAVGEKVASTPQPAAAGVPAASTAKIDALLLKKKFSAGKVAFNQKTRELTLTYDFRNQNQLKDFDVSNAQQPFNNGSIRLGPTESISHVAKFNSVSVSGVFNIKHRERKILIGASCGVSLRYREDDFDIYQRNQEMATRELPNMVGAIPIRFYMTETKSIATIGNAEFGKPIQAGKVGNVSFEGGEAGSLFSSLIISGIIDEEWLKDFLEM